MDEQRVIAGRYRLDEPLGLGGMASVWAGHDLELERPVAVKILARDADRARFEREARAAAMLTHPNVCRLYDFGESEEGPYMVLELLPGGSLEDRLAPGTPLPDAETARIAAEVADGLAAAHASGLVHRDLKPANILFDAEDRARIADFGIARIGGAGTLTEAGTVLGTAAYISPEQGRGEPAGPASDVYSFGTILYRMLAGRLPFEAEEPMALVAMHVNEAPPPVAELRPDAPARLAAVADAALAKDPAARPPDGRALAAELGPLAAVPTGPGKAAPTVALGPAAAPRLPVRRTMALAAGVLALGGAGLAAALLATRSGAPDPVDPASPATAGATTDAPAPAPATTTRATTQETVTITTPATTAEPEPPTTETEPEPPPTETPPTETAPTETEPED